METKLMRVPTSVQETLRELSNRTGLDMVDILADIFGTIQKQLDLQEANKRLLFMADLYTKDNVPKTIIRLSDALCTSLSEIPVELQKDILNAFDYRLGERGEFIDTRADKQEAIKLLEDGKPKRLSHTEQIQRKHDEEVAREQNKNIEG